MSVKNPQLGYDERPDPKAPGQQGVLFRRVAPAMTENTRYGGMLPETAIAEQNEGNYNARPSDRATRRGRVFGIGGHSEGENGVIYHGTAAKLKPDSIIKPGKNPNWGAQGSGDIGTTGRGGSRDVNRENAFATENLHDAHRYARVAQQQRREGNTGRTGNPNAPANVYRVQPLGPVTSDAEDEDHRGGYSEGPSVGAYQSKQGFRVLHPVQFSEHQEAYRNMMEDTYGMDPGSYEFAPKVSHNEDWY